MVLAGGVSDGVAAVITSAVLILPAVTAPSSTSPPDSLAARRSVRAFASRTPRAAIRWLICSWAALRVKTTPVFFANGSWVIGRGLGAEAGSSGPLPPGPLVIPDWNAVAVRPPAHRSRASTPASSQPLIAAARLMAAE